MMRNRTWMAMILLVLCGVAAGAQSATPDAMGGMDMGTPKTGTAPQQKPGGEMNGMDMMSHCKMMAQGEGKGMDMSQCMEMMQKMHMGQMGMNKPVPAGTLRVMFGSKSIELTAADLAALPHAKVTVTNAKTKASEIYSGVELMALLAKVGVAEKPEGKDLLLYVIAQGSDGYKVVYSLAEVSPGTHDATVIVADSKGGKSLEGEGPFLLAGGRETRRVRWVKNLSAIQVRSAE